MFANTTGLDWNWTVNPNQSTSLLGAGPSPHPPSGSNRAARATNWVQATYTDGSKECDEHVSGVVHAQPP